MQPQFAVLGDAKQWRWFSHPLERIKAASNTPLADTWNQIQSASECHPVTFTIDYETSVSGFLGGSKRGLEAVVWDKYETLSDSELFSRLPDPAKQWSWELECDASTWVERIGQLKAYLEAGDCYQGNLTIRGRGHCDATPEALWRALIERQRVPYAALMPWQGGAAISLSPELLWSVADNKIECQPMKGTIGLGQSPAQTQELAQWLSQDPKNRAENLMILDLIRNDLGRIAQPGSVSVPESFVVRRYQTLQQMVSTVTAQLSTARLADWAEALMPYGSITGAPKKRAIEVLERLELSPRGLYTGSCGFIYRGESVANVAIRTATLQEGVLEFGVGGGITLDSDPMDEWQEVQLKTRFISPP